MTNTLNKNYFTEEEALEMVIEALREDNNLDLEDLHNEVFNTNYYIIGTYEAEKALEQYGTFNAINEVNDYEQEEFGETSTNLTSPESVANMLWYIIGQRVVSELDVWEFENARELLKSLED